MFDDPIDVTALRSALGWTQQQLADHCGTDRSTVSKWEKEPPTKGPALVLLRQLRDRATVASAGPDASQAGAGASSGLEAAE